MTDTERTLRLMIADDQPLIRRALSMTLGAESDIEIVGQAVDGQDAIEQALALTPDVVVMDLQMPRVSGVVATRDITAKLLESEGWHVVVNDIRRGQTQPVGHGEHQAGQQAHGQPVQGARRPARTEGLEIVFMDLVAAHEKHCGS